MTVDGTQGLLEAIHTDWSERGWDFDSFRSFRMELAEDTGTNEEVETPEVEGTEQETSQGSDYSGYSEFVQNLLKEAPAEHQQLLEPYIKKWDAGVSRRFNELQTQLKPYKEFGEVEELQQAVNFYRMLEDDDEARKIYESLHSYFNPNETPGAANGNTGQNQPLLDEEQEFQELPPAVMQQLAKQEQILQMLAQHYLTEQEQNQIAEEDRELDQTMTQLKTEFGDFDEDYVLTKMYSGMDAVDAVKAYQTMMQERLAAYQQTQRTPPTLGGGGSVPSESQNLAKVPNKDLKNFVAGLLEQSANGN